MSIEHRLAVVEQVARNIPTPEPTYAPGAYLDYFAGLVGSGRLDSEPDRGRALDELRAAVGRAKADGKDVPSRIEDMPPDVRLGLSWLDLMAQRAYLGEAPTVGLAEAVELADWFARNRDRLLAAAGRDYWVFDNCVVFNDEYLTRHLPEGPRTPAGESQCQMARRLRARFGDQPAGAPTAVESTD